MGRCSFARGRGRGLAACFPTLSVLSVLFFCGSCAAVFFAIDHFFWEIDLEKRNIAERCFFVFGHSDGQLFTVQQ